MKKKVKNLLKLLKAKGIVRKYDSGKTNNIVAFCQLDNNPAFVLMIDAKLGQDIENKKIIPNEMAKETIIYQFDDVEKIDNWIEVLKLIKHDMLHKELFEEEKR